MKSTRSKVCTAAAAAIFLSLYARTEAPPPPAGEEADGQPRPVRWQREAGEDLPPATPALRAQFAAETAALRGALGAEMAALDSVGATHEEKVAAADAFRDQHREAIAEAEHKRAAILRARWLRWEANLGPEGKKTLGDLRAAEAAARERHRALRAALAAAAPEDRAAIRAASRPAEDAVRALVLDLRSALADHARTGE